jgi:hypothetical protein
MNNYVFWRQWGHELNDLEFANAYLALGVLARKNKIFSDEPINGAEWPKDESEPEIDETEFGKVMIRILTGFRYNNYLISWKYPLTSDFTFINKAWVKLSALNPVMLSGVWADAVRYIGNSRTHIRVISYPDSAKEHMYVWLSALYDANPVDKSVFINYPARRAILYLKWPLRLGYLTDNDAKGIIEGARSYWPSSKLTSITPIDRMNANCDVLVFTGNGDAFLKNLHDLPVPQKANLIIMRSDTEYDMVKNNRQPFAIPSECHASGIIYLRSSTSDEELSKAINDFVTGLSHNLPLDVAIFNAFVINYQVKPIMFLNKHLATFQLEHSLEKIHVRLKRMPVSINLKMKSIHFKRMDIPIDDRMHLPVGPSMDSPSLERTYKQLEVAGDEISIPPGDFIKKFEEFREQVTFDRESAGASRMAEMTDAIDDAESRTVEEKQQRRFLQEQIFMQKNGAYVSEHRAFLLNVSTKICIRIAPPDIEWETVSTEFPDWKLPAEQEEWRLGVVLSEPNHLKKPMRGTILLQRYGVSSECAFNILLNNNKDFEGRITVVHRGRVLQTAILKGRVVSEENEIKINDKISFIDKLSVRSNVGDLESRRQFDLAFVLNHTSDERPRLTAIAADHAWCSDLTESKKITIDINTALSKISKSVNDYAGGIHSIKNQALLVELANLGNALYWSIVEEQLYVNKNRKNIAGKEYIQIVSTKDDTVVPFEFIYEFDAPDDDAKPCSLWQDALTNGSCSGDCKMDKTKNVCPLGFWGVSKVIERHDLTPELGEAGKELFLLSETTRDRQTLSITGNVVAAASTRVLDQAFSPVLSTCTTQFGIPAYQANNWKDWADLVQQYKPGFLLALPHTDGNGILATLEIGGNKIRSNHIREAHVRSKGAPGYPLVALLGCDTSGTAQEYGSHVRWFRRKGAGVVIGTVATVFGEHAANVAEMLITGLKQNNIQPECLGEIIRSIKRKALLQGNLMPLCIVAYGDADWKIN